jgi:Rrf2 family protein
MRITKEADYALRIMLCLSECADDVKDAKTMSELLNVPPRFTLKILHKLMTGKLVKSYKGVNGGYKLNFPPNEITMRQIVEVIDGPLAISRCLDTDYECSHMTHKKSGCYFHRMFSNINVKLADELEKITLDMALRNEEI